MSNDPLNTSVSSKITTNTAASKRKARKMWDVKTNLDTVDEIKQKLRKEHGIKDDNKNKRAKSQNVTKSKNMAKDMPKNNVGDISELHSVQNQIKDKNPIHIKNIEDQIIRDIENEVQYESNTQQNPATQFNMASQFNPNQHNNID